MRVGIYLGRHRGSGGGIGVYARALVRELIVELAKPGFHEDELVLYGDSAVLTPEILDDLSMADVLATEAAEYGYAGAGRYFKTLPNGARSRVLIRKLPDSFGYKAGMIRDQAVLPFYAWWDGLDLLHSVANIGAVFSSCRQLVTVHDLFQAFPPDIGSAEDSAGSQNKKTSAVQRFFRKLFARQFKNVEHLLTDTGEIAEEIHRRYGFDLARIDVVKLGLDHTFCSYLSYRAGKEHADLMKDWQGIYQVPEGFVLLFASQDPRKNMARQIEAWKLLPDALKQKRLIVLGADAKTKRLIKQMLNDASKKREKDAAKTVQEDNESAEKPLSDLDCVTFLPNVDRSELPFLMASAGVLLNATLAEGFGLPAHEAIAVDTSAVTAALEGLADVSSDRIYTCAPEDAKSISQALATALGSSSADDAESAAAGPASEKPAKEVKWRTMRDCAADTFGVYKKVVLRYER